MMIRTICLVFMMQWLLLFSCSPDQSLNRQTAETTAVDKTYEAIDSLMRARHESGRFDGSIVIASNEKVIYQGEFGLADRSWDIPVAADTRFDIASLNKSFTGALILIAEEEGRLSVDDRLVDHLDSFSYTGSFDSSVTLHQMLTHTSGFPDYDGVEESLMTDGFRRLKRLHMSNKEYVDFISLLDPVAPPGERFHYSNFAYHLLNILLEEIYGASYQIILQEKICGPLKMDNTLSVMDNEQIIEKLARGYTWNESEKAWKENDFIDLTLGRRIFSTSSDLMRWAEAMNDDRLLPDSARKRMLTNHLEGPYSYGYGVVVFDGKGDYSMGSLETERNYIIHGGNTGGYRSMLVNADEGEIVITFLSNTGDRTEELELAKQLLKCIDH